METINLIPQAEVQEQQKTKAIKLSSVISIIILLIVLGVSGFYFYQSYQLKAQINGVNNEIKDLRASIAAQAPIEIAARNLDKKYTTIQGIFNGSLLYSKLSSEITTRTPSGVLLDSLVLQKGTKVSISGKADNYVSIANFTSNLLNKEFGTGDPTLKDLFTTVVLNTVNLEKSKDIVRFAITVDLKTDNLKVK